MDPPAAGTNDDVRHQPWKEWAMEEIKARKEADTTAEGRKAQEERVRAFKNDGNNDGDESPANKAG